MSIKHDTIRRFLGNLNDDQNGAGYWLPNIQRAFVWKEKQIERLFDSLLREYPIGTFLVWKTKQEVKMRKFIDNYHDNLQLKEFYMPENSKQKHLVLDGQQRLQSLFLSLKGSLNGRELYFNLLSGEAVAPEDIKYIFKFYNSSQAAFPFVKMKDMVYTDKMTSELRHEIVNKYHPILTEEQASRLERNIELIKHVFCTKENISYFEVDSIDKPLAYTEDDIVEIFIRANSGGTTLSKSDLMFSLLISGWEDAQNNMAELLRTLNQSGYHFNQDFILKTCLVLLDKGSRYDVLKLRDKSTRDDISKKWDEISDALVRVKDFLYGSTFLTTDKLIPSYLSIIPIVYVFYKYPSFVTKYSARFKEYILRTALTSVFSGSPDFLLDKIINQIKKDGDFNLQQIYGIIREDGRSLEVSKETILALNYWKKEIHIYLNLWYGFDYHASYYGNKPQIDHIFPQSLLKKIKEKNPENGIWNIMKYKWQSRDQIANLMLLTAEENGAGGKGDKPPDQWFADKSDNYLERHLIPKDKELWKIENFEQFIAARKKLILEKFSYLIFNERI